MTDELGDLQNTNNTNVTTDNSPCTTESDGIELEEGAVSLASSQPSTVSNISEGLRLLCQYVEFSEISFKEVRGICYISLICFS